MLTIHQLLPRNSLLWMVAAQTVAIIPLLFYLPFWLILLWLFAVCWRVQVFRGAWQVPGQKVKTLMALLVIGGLAVSFQQFLALEPMASLLVCACSLKLMEMDSRRDALLLIYLSFFLTAVLFLFTQEMYIAFYAILILPVLVSALLAVHQTQGLHRPSRTVGLSFKLMLHSIPLMLLLFFVIPRVGSLWSVPQPGGGTTGISGSMEPGDIQSLTRSSEVALRVTFEQGWPMAPNERYWRGAVLSVFDGRRWDQASPADYGYGQVIHWNGGPIPDWRANANALSADRLNYQVMMEPTRQPWLFSAGLPIHYPDSGLVKVGLARDFRLIANAPVGKRVQYTVAAARHYQLDPGFLSQRQRRLETRIPRDSNPQSQRIARLWYAQSGDVESYIERVLTLYRQSFSYSLEVPLLGRHSVDEFLWGTQIGYCEHFASSFAFMMRAAGIPARVVVGYQGGEFIEELEYLLVRQYDAHAWTEVWMEGRGWVRIDPTASVAPNRIELPMDMFAENELGRSVSGLGWGGALWFSQLTLQWDALNYQWHRRVLGFDRDGQAKLLNQWFNGVTPLKLVIFVLGIGTATLAAISLQFWWQQRGKPVSKQYKYYHRLESSLAKYKLIREPGESLSAFCQRCCIAQPLIREELTEAFEMLERQVYRQETIDRERFKALTTRVRRGGSRP